jgi:hypothetical protein
MNQFTDELGLLMNNPPGLAESEQDIISGNEKGQSRGIWHKVNTLELLQWQGTKILWKSNKWCEPFPHKNTWLVNTKFCVYMNLRTSILKHMGESQCSVMPCGFKDQAHPNKSAFPEASGEILT